MQRLRVVHKVRYNEQSFISIPAQDNELQPSSIRVQTKVVGLSSNNLAYCAAGDLLHWWSAFPVPIIAEPHYNDTSQYGISPGWGYMIVLDSSIDQIEPGRMIFGFVPISSHAVDLQLQPSGIENHWIETSSQRSRVMSMYQRYILMPQDFNMYDPQALWAAALIKSEAGQVLAKYVFPQDESAPIHPFGNPVSPWTEREASLADTCLILIASGTKTAKAFIYTLASIVSAQKPGYSVVEVTSGFGCRAYLKDIRFEHKIVSYNQISDSEAFPPHKKYVLLNLGGRENAFERVWEAVRKSYPKADIIPVQIGGEPKVTTKEILQERQAFVAKSQAVRMNTTAIRDVAVERYGEEQYFSDLDRTFNDMIQEQMMTFDNKVLGMSLMLCTGLNTSEGIKGTWSKIVNGQIDATQAFVVSL